jgi:hypothetical protein
MDPETRRQLVDIHLQELRSEATAQRLARGGQDRFGSPYPTARIPRTLGAWRRLIGAAGA